MATVSLLVEIDMPYGHEFFAAEAVEVALRAAIDDGQLLCLVGSSAGHNPPYERHPELISVTAELE